MCCVLGGSLIGPVSNIVAPEDVFVKNIWRAGILVVYLLIPSLIEFKYKKKSDYASFFTCKNYGIFTAVYICHALWGLGIVYGGVNLIQTHAYVLNTSVGSFMLIFSFIACTKPILIEIVAFFIVLTGQIIMIADPHAEREDGKQGSFFVYLITLGSAAFGAGFFILGDKQIKQLPLYFYFMILSFHQFFIWFILAKISDSRTTFFSTDKEWGAFGFFDPS